MEAIDVIVAAMALLIALAFLISELEWIRDMERRVDAMRRALEDLMEDDDGGD